MKNYTINWTQLFSYVIIVVLIGMLFKSCEKQRIATDESENYLKAQNVFKGKIKVAEYKISQYTDTVLSFEKEVSKLNSKIKNLDSKYIPKIEGVKHYNSTDIAKFYKDAYKLPKQVETVANGTVLSDTVARLNIRDVFLGSLNAKKLSTANNLLKNKDSIIKYKDSSLVQKDTIILNAKKALTDCEKTNLNLNNDNKKTRKSNLLLKLGLGALAIIGIVF